MQNKNTLLIVAVVILVAVVAFFMLNKSDQRNPIQKVGDAVQTGDMKQLENRTPGEKIKDAVKDNTK